jgi:hypothetical protein
VLGLTFHLHPPVLQKAAVERTAAVSNLRARRELGGAYSAAVCRMFCRYGAMCSSVDTTRTQSIAALEIRALYLNGSEVAGYG